MKKEKILNSVLAAFFAALLAVMSQITIPTPFGVPLTFQTFSVALCGYISGTFVSLEAVAVWIALGIVGAPVFSGFGGGTEVIFGPTGGFIWGFLLLAFFCGISRGKRMALRLLFGTVGLFLCHFAGAIQYKFVYGVMFETAVITVCLPYLFKDFVLLAVANSAAEKIKTALYKQK